MKVRVNDGRTVDDGKKIHKPGDSFECDDKEGERLIRGKVVSLFEEVKSDEPGAANEPTQTDRQKLLVLAIGALNPNTAERADWTRSGDPQTAALEEILGDGVKVTAAERDAAYDVFLAAQESQQ